MVNALEHLIENKRTIATIGFRVQKNSNYSFHCLSHCKISPQGNGSAVLDIPGISDADVTLAAASAAASAASAAAAASSRGTCMLGLGKQHCSSCYSHSSCSCSISRWQWSKAHPHSPVGSAWAEQESESGLSPVSKKPMEPTNFQK